MIVYRFIPITSTFFLLQADITTYTNVSQYFLQAVKSMELGDVEEDLGNVIMHFHGCVWNAAITFERDSQATPLDICLLRFTSVQISMQRLSGRAFCLVKVASALKVFDQRWKEGGGRQRGTDVPRRVFSQIMCLMDEVFHQDEIRVNPLLTLTVNTYDFLASFQEVDCMDFLWSKLLTCPPKGCSSSFENTAAILGHFRVATHIWECIGDQHPQAEHSDADLTTWLTRILHWAQRTQQSTTDSENDQCFIEVIYWLQKHIKARHIRKDVVVKLECLSLMQHVFRETHMFFALRARQIMNSQWDVDKTTLTRTHLDSHRCWLILYHLALSERPSPETDECK